MTKRMLIDATHPEETRVVVLDGTRLEEYDVETATKRQLKGNIYLAKVVRVEPSLQAAFIEYGGNRHGFLAFGEIHPDYYQIPVADRQRLLAAQAEAARLEQEEEDRAAAQDERRAGGGAETGSEAVPDGDADTETDVERETGPEDEAGAGSAARAQAAVIETARVTAPDEAVPDEAAPHAAADDAAPDVAPDTPASAAAAVAAGTDTGTPRATDETPPAATAPDAAPAEPGAGAAPVTAAEDGRAHAEPAADLPPPETVGGESDGESDQHSRSIPIKYLRNYKIQEVIKRRQIMLVQVVKEERGSKGAALTTYLSLAGRYCVLMPNSPRGGGISRKITSAADRKRLKEVMAELDIPDGMGLIVRTAGANRPKPEIKRDCEYLMRLWDDIREHTMQSVAPALIYEEASLIKRAIRDVYSRDVDEIVVDGEEAWRAARNFMNMLIPSHARKVILHKDTEGTAPLFTCHQVEAQLDSMLSPTVQLKSGGYLVINQAEALVAIDVNSGRSTRERNIEETALRTNLEAADEVARQLRLRDLAGLIVIDFIDMESKKHNAMVERRIKDALKGDRARIQVGHISHFGLLEMSRQRLRPSLAETNFTTCPHCNGIGLVRTTESAAIHVLRAIEEEGARQRAAEVMVHVAPALLLYLFNHKRDRLATIERRYQMRVLFDADAALSGTQHRIDRLRAQVPREGGREEPGPVAMLAPAADIAAAHDEAAYEIEAVAEPGEATETTDAAAAAPPRERRPDGADAESATAEDGRPRRRRRRRRRGGRRDETGAGVAGDDETFDAAAEQGAADEDDAADTDGAADQPAPAGEVTPAAHAPADAQAPVAAEAGPADAEPTVAAPPAAPPTEPAQTGAGQAEALEDDGAPRKRSRRGGRRRRREPGEGDAPLPQVALPGSEQPDLPARPYAGPTPADPFGGHTYDIFDVMEQAEARAAAASRPAAATGRGQQAEAARAPTPDAPAAPASEPAPEPMHEPAEEPPAPPPQAASHDAAPSEAPAADTPAPAEETARPDTAAAHGAGASANGAEHAAAPAADAPEAEARPAPADAAEPEPAPVVKPIVIGSAPPPERKQGWWRR